uniref:Uncharacterized protein n=1 Tax=Schistosoma mansoni TaxID=6183 RepID=A0A5K4F9R4_SCHMA
MCQPAVMSTPASLNNQTDKVNEMEITTTDDDDDLNSDEIDENFFNKLVLAIIMFFKSLLQGDMESNEIYNTTMNV